MKTEKTDSVACIVTSQIPGPYGCGDVVVRSGAQDMTLTPEQIKRLDGDPRITVRRLA